MKPRQQKDFALLAYSITILSDVSFTLRFCCNLKNCLPQKALASEFKLHLRVRECQTICVLPLCHFLSCERNHTTKTLHCYNSSSLPFTRIIDLSTCSSLPFMSDAGRSILFQVSPGTGSGSGRLQDTLGSDLSLTPNGSLMTLASLEYLIVPN